MKHALVAMCLCLPAMGQATYSGTGAGSGSAVYGSPWQGILAGENAYCAPGSSGELTEGTPMWGTSDGPATLSSQCMNTAVASTPSGTHIGGGGAATFVPATSATLSNVLASSATSLINLDGTTTGSPSYYLQCGDTIQLTAGASYQGSFTFPALACDGGHWIPVKSSGVSNGNFPAEGVRATPCLAGIPNDATNGYNAPGYPPYSCPSYPAILTAQLETTATNNPAIQFVTGSNYYRFIGIEVTKQADVRIGKLITMAPDGQTQGANHIIFDRMVIHGQPWVLSSGINSEAQGGIGAKDSQWVALINSWNYDTYCVSSCIDSQAFAAGSGTYQDGPFKLYNNMLASSGETFIFGGGGQGPGTPITNGFEFRANVAMKPLAWMVPIETCYLYNTVDPKNLGEFKDGSYVLIEGNYFANSWYGCQSDQDGTALLLDPRNQSLAQNLSVTFDGTDMVVTTPGPKLFTNTYGGGQVGYPDNATYCPAGGCRLTVSGNGPRYYFCNGANGCDQTGTTLHTDGKSARLVTPTGGPPAAGTVTASSCVPGIDPSAATNNVVVRYNEIYNVVNGVYSGTAVSDCGDEAQSLDHVSIHDNYLHGLSWEMMNSSSPPPASSGFSVQNGQVYSIVHALTIAHNTIGVETGNSAFTGALGQQREGQDNRYLQGFNVHDNVSPAAWHVIHTAGALSNGGLGYTFQTDACQPYYPNDAANDTDGAGNVLNTIANGTLLSWSTSLSHYIVTWNGKLLTYISSAGPTSFVTGSTGHSITMNAGDALTVRDVTACDWTFVGNVLGEGLPGSGSPEDPYPNGTDPYSGLATPNANNSNSCGVGAAHSCILGASDFAALFNSWDPRSGDLRIASSATNYKGGATDATSRASTGQDPGTDFTTLSSLLAGVHTPEVYPALSISSGTLTAETHGVPFDDALATPAYGVTGGGASPYKSWWQETDTSHCGGNCGTTPAALVAAGIIIGRDGTVNGPFVILTVSRASAVSTFNPKMQMVSEMLGTPVVPWQVGQVITLSGFVDYGTGDAAHDSSFNGTCTISTVTTNTFSCTQSGTGYDDINSHKPYHAGGTGAPGVITFAPITPGSYQFWMGVKDGAFQKAWAQIAVTVN